MGTSVSQGSQRNTNWRAVHVCYEKSAIPENRLINEIWRASENESIPVSDGLKSDAVYNCYEAIRNSSTFPEALNKATAALITGKNNSMMAEFAKRVIPFAFQSRDPVAAWAAGFFSEVTNYIVSRDISGFVGDKYRNKSVNEMVSFKRSLADKVTEAISSQPLKITSKREWNSFVDASVNTLKKL